MPCRRLITAGFCSVALALGATVASSSHLQPPSAPRDRQAQESRFHLEEATIGDVHRAIQLGQITCRQVVQAYNDRAGIHCRSVVDAVRVLDALRDPAAAYYDPRDIFTTVPRSSIRTEGYASAIADGRPGALAGMRIGIVREFMVKHTKADEPIVDAVSAEITSVLGKHLGATLVESVARGWVDDPEIPNMLPSFDQAIAQILPVLFPDLLFRLTPAREPEFPAFAGRIEPTTFAAGVTKGTGSLQPADWMLRWAYEAASKRRVPPPAFGPLPGEP